MPGSVLQRLRHRRSRASRERDRLLQLAGRSQALSVRSGGHPTRLSDVEFSVYSQYGEDGILAFLTGAVEITDRTFVEIGVQDYTECNTRLLAATDGWRGVVIDVGKAHLRTLEESGLRWKHHVDGVSAWVTRDNVDRLISGAGLTGDIGLLSLDIDGNDYWVLEALTVVSPRIVVVEYNAAFGPVAAVSIPYDEQFDRTTAHPGNRYYGASLAAFHHLLAGRGYRLAGCNGAGNNAFFVRDDVAGPIVGLTPAQAHVPSIFRDSRDARGALTYLKEREALTAAASLPLVDVVTGQAGTVASLVLGAAP